MIDRGYDVVIVGGGVIGLSIARELKRDGVERVVLLEREGAVGQRSSSRANGGVRAQFATSINIAFSLYSIEEFERLAAEHGNILQFHQTGYLFATGTERGEALLSGSLELQRSLGLEAEWLTPPQVLGRAPIVREDGLRGGTWYARDGFLPPRCRRGNETRGSHAGGRAPAQLGGSRPRASPGWLRRDDRSG